MPSNQQNEKTEFASVLANGQPNTSLLPAVNPNDNTADRPATENPQPANFYQP